MPKKRKYPLSAVEVGKARKVWFYQNGRGIEVVTQLRDDNGYYIGTTIATIPWKYLEASVRLHQREMKK